MKQDISDLYMVILLLTLIFSSSIRIPSQKPDMAGCGRACSGPPVEGGYNLRLLYFLVPRNANN